MNLRARLKKEVRRGNCSDECEACRDSINRILAEVRKEIPGREVGGADGYNRAIEDLEERLS